jgi:curved DNA-binding protein CbpA
MAAATRGDRGYRRLVDRVEAARELGVPSSAAAPLVEKAFRRAARSRHPDVGGDPVAFRRATEARAVLLRPRQADTMDRVVQIIIRHHPVVRLVEALARVIERNTSVR